MLPLVIFGILYTFLFAGAVSYLIAIAVPRTRPYAFSAAFWFAALGPCILGILMLWGLGAILHGFVSESGYIAPHNLPNLEALGWTYAILGLLGSILVASGIAFLHQSVIHRFTFFLFRLYATAVSAGIGGTLAIGLGWIALIAFDKEWPRAFLLLAPILAALLGIFAYRSARTLRGTQPERFPWVTPEEFSGLPTPHAPSHASNATR